MILPTTSTASNQETKDSLKLLLDTIKLNAQNSSDELNLSSFKNIMKMVNNQNNSSDLNTYLSQFIFKQLFLKLVTLNA